METVELCRFIGETFPSFNQISGGLAPNYYNLSKELLRFGVQTSILCTGKKSQPEFEEQDGIRVYRQRPMPSKVAELYFHLPSGIRAFKKSNEIKKDLFQFHNFYAYWLQSFVKEPNVLTVHGCDFEIYRNVPLWPIEMPAKHFKSWWEIKRTLIMSKKMCRNADAVVGVAEAVSREVKKEFGAKKVVTIYNGIDKEIFLKTKGNAFEKHSDTFNLLFVGRITPLKGLCYLLEAVEGLSGVKLFIAGEIDGSSKTYFDLMMRKVKHPERIVLLGKIANKDLPRYYSGADCFVLPTLAEGLPKVVLEAMACECPVITTDVSGNPEIVNEKTGYLVGPKSSAELKRAIIYIMQNKKEAHKRAQKAREMVRNNFTWRKSAERYAKLYKKTLAK